MGFPAKACNTLRLMSGVNFDRQPAHMLHSLHMFKGLERELRRRGEHPLADTVHALLKLRGKDIPFGESVFTPEQRSALKSKGYVMYPLTGQSIASLRDAGCPFWSTWHTGKPFETAASLHTEVAINPNRLFLPKSKGKILDEQIAMVAEFGKKIGREVPGTTAILGSVAEYAELAFAHLDRKGQRLFGKDFDYEYTRTTTLIGGQPLLTIVGQFRDNYGPHVDILHPGLSNIHVGAAPLVVPTSAVGR
jgi:hypothetical protein